MKINSFLALGDSYTIGEQVPLYDSFPYQAMQLLRKAGLSFYAPEIIAKTGWTTDELKAGISNSVLLDRYDIVTLLIGVNNQYRERSVDEFEIEFNALLELAIKYAGDPLRVYVISIPDWGVTPFAEGRDREKIAKEIDEFNKVCSNAALSHHANFIEITSSQRAETSPDFLAPDGLHPSGKEYVKWAKLLAAAVRSTLK